MFTSLSSFGFSSTREHRMLGMTATPERMGGSSIPGVDMLNTFFTSVTNSVEKSLGREKIRAEATAANLRNPTLWLRAFDNPDAFTGPQRDITTIGTEFGPDELLSTKTQAQRTELFFKFIRGIVPAPIMARHPEFNNPGFRENIDTYLAGGGTLTLPDAGTRAEILQTAGLVIGTRNATPGRAFDLAKDSFREIYPPDSFGKIYQDYRSEVRRLRNSAGTRPGTTIPTNDDLRSRTFLIERLNTLSVSTFLGYLKVEDPVVAQARLNALADQRERDEASREEAKLKTELLYEQLDKKPREEAEKANRPFFTNLEAAYQANPVATAVAVGVVGYTLWRMFRSENAFMRAIPIGLGGTYLYLALRGEANPLGTMIGNTERFGRSMAGNITNLLRGTMPPTPGEQDRARLALMGRFATEKSFLNSFPAEMAVMTAADVPVNMLAGDTLQMGFNATTGRIDYRLYAAPTHPLYLTMQKIIKARGYDSNTLHGIFHEHNGVVARTMGNVFYHLAAMDPANAEKVKRIEGARQTAAKAGIVSNMSYDNITDPSVSGDYFDLMQRGRTLAMTRYPNQSLSQIIEMIMRENEPQRPDFAEPLPVPGVGTNATREQERKLYASNRTPLVANRVESINAIRDEFGEFVNYWTAPNRRIMDPAAAKHLREFVEAMLVEAPPTRSFNDINTTVERLKYAVLVSAAVRSGENPMNLENMRDLLGQAPGAANEPGTVEQILGSVTNWINRELLTVSSSFQNVNSISNVEAILRERLFSGVNSEAGLKRLQAQMATHRARFAQLRTPAQASEIFTRSLPATIVGNFGTGEAGRKNLNTFAQRMIASPQYQEFVNNSERYYAQRVVNDLLVAQISTHRRDGNHVLDTNVSERWISPTEEQNLVANNDWLLRQILGPTDRPMSGMFSAMAMRQLLQDVPTPPVFNEADEGERLAHVNHTRRLAYLYLSLQPITPEADVDAQLRTRVRTVAQKFVARYQAVYKEAGSPDERTKRVTELRNTASYAQGVPDIVSTMRLLNMTAGADAGTLKVLSELSSETEVETKKKFVEEEIAVKKKLEEEAAKKKLDEEDVKKKKIAEDELAKKEKEKKDAEAKGKGDEDEKKEKAKKEAEEEIAKKKKLAEDEEAKKEKEKKDAEAKGKGAEEEVAKKKKLVEDEEAKKEKEKKDAEAKGKGAEEIAKKKKLVEEEEAKKKGG